MKHYYFKYVTGFLTIELIPFGFIYSFKEESILAFISVIPLFIYIIIVAFDKLYKDYE